MAAKPDGDDQSKSQPSSNTIESQFTYEPGVSSKMESERLEPEDDVFISTSEEFVDLQLEDFTWKIRARKSYGWVLISLLIAQNLVVFSMVGVALLLGEIEDLQLIFAVLVSATLGETAFMVKVIVEWLFKDINYPEV
jgi:hypothetical protein